MNINEQVKWESDVKLLTRQEKVEGGASGAANTQASQLGNRTQWLKAQIESVRDYREHTFYKTDEDPDGTIAGMAATSEGELFRVSQGPDSDAAFIYYWHKNGVPVEDATLAGAGAISNLLPLNKSTVFSSGEGYPFADDFHEVSVDSENNIISYWKGMNFVTFLNWLFPSIETDKLSINGLPVTDENILKAIDKKNLEILSGTQAFSGLDNEVEFKLGYQFDSVSLDSLNNIMWAWRGADYFNYMNCNFRRADIAMLSVKGVELDAEGILAIPEKENLTRLSQASQFIAPESFPFNPSAWVVLDENSNVIFRVEDYWAALSRLDELVSQVAQLEGQKTNPLLPFAQNDSNGKSQVYVYNTETGKQSQVTSGTSNETAPRTDGPDRILWQSDRADNAPGGLFYAKLPELIPHACIARKKIVGWGHSFIHQGAFLKHLAALTGLPTYNFGLSGQTSDAIAARQGGAPAWYAPVGGVIPASGPVTLTPAVAGPCRSLAAPVNLKCRLAGVDGTFTWDGTSATFTRLSSGDAVAVSVLTPLHVYPVTTAAVSGSIPINTQYDLHDECINVFWIGRNNLKETDLIFNNLVSMVEYVKPLGQEIAICADFNTSTESTGTAGYQQMMELNSRVKNKFPEFYCEIGGVDIRQNFINHANPASADDMEDVSKGLTPRSLRYDNLHPAQALSGSGGSLAPDYALGIGANINAQFTCDFFQSRGWI